jgi:hypothetical protein
LLPNKLDRTIRPARKPTNLPLKNRNGDYAPLPAHPTD